MALKIEEIDSAEKLEVYLQDKPKELAQIIASRCALRVLPVAQSNFDNKNDHSAAGALAAFRFNFITWAGRNWLKHRIEVKHFNSEFLNNSLLLATIPSELEAVIATENQLDKFKSAVTSAAFSASISNFAQLVSIKESFIAVSYFSNFESSFFLECIARDLKEFLKTGSVKYIIDMPLWYEIIPLPIITNWELLKEYLLLLDSNWQVWTDWYEHVLYGANSPKRGIAALSDETLIKFAQKPNKFWERDPDVVNAEIAGWVVGAQDLKTSDENNQSEEPKTELNQRRNYLKSELNAVKSTVEINRESIALLSASTLLQISDFREKVRGINQLELMFREGLLGFLDTLSGDLEKLSELTLKLVTDPTDENAENTLNWLNRFKSRFNDKCQEYIEPENIANAAVPTAIILSCGGIGSLLGGPLGFGAGTVFGKFLTGELKAGGATDKISKMFDADDNKKAAE